MDQKCHHDNDLLPTSSPPLSSTNTNTNTNTKNLMRSGRLIHKGEEEMTTEVLRGRHLNMASIDRDYEDIPLLLDDEEDESDDDHGDDDTSKKQSRNFWNPEKSIS